MSRENKWKIIVKHSRNTGVKLEVRPWGVLVTLPEGVGEDEVARIIERYRVWIERKHSELLEAIERSKNIELLERSKAEFKRLLKSMVKQVTREVLGVNPCRIVVKKMKTRWASCSFKGTITVNSLAIYLPEHLIAYIVYHEICHLIEPRHNGAFLECLRKRYPNYGELEKELLAYEIKLGLHSESTYKE